MATPHRVRRWIASGVLTALVAIVVGPFVYINVLRDSPPERLAVTEDPAITRPGQEDGRGRAETSTAIPTDGVWAVSDGSQAGTGSKRCCSGKTPKRPVVRRA